jgi:hypothetical protein
MVRNISSINILCDLENHLENSKHLLRSCVCSRTGWAIADYKAKMHMPILSQKSNFNIFNKHEMTIVLCAFQLDVMPELSRRLNEWGECINEISY